jgi:hypothetical protein
MLSLPADLDGNLIRVFYDLRGDLKEAAAAGDVPPNEVEIIH